MEKEEKIEMDWIYDARDKIKDKMAWVILKNHDKIPYMTDSAGNYDDLTNRKTSLKGFGIDWWTNGFFAGIVWEMYQVTGMERYAEIARKSEEKLDQCFDDFLSLHHDVGFMYLLSGVADYRLTKDKDGRKRGLHAATILAGRFNPVGQFIRAWNEWGDDTRGWVIIDCMMNLALLYWAAEETRDPRFRHIAMMHADTTMKHFVQADGSVHHIVEFDPETGNMVRAYPGQGYAQGSAWTRGQAWAIYGFTISYLHTKKLEYLETAKKVANYFIDHLSEDAIVPIDFCQPVTPPYEDSSAACIAASGLLELSNCVPQSEKKIYRDRAIRILKTICEKRACWSQESDAIVKNCSTSYHNGDHDITLIYADYFFSEAVLKLTGEYTLFW